MIQGYNSSDDYLIKYGQSYSKLFSLLVIISYVYIYIYILHCRKIEAQVLNCLALLNKHTNFKYYYYNFCFGVTLNKI